MRTDTRVALAGLGIAVCLLPVRRLTDDPQDVPRFLWLAAGAFACYFVALLVLRKGAARIGVIGIVAIAAAIQFAPFKGVPLWDTDSYRYHWDGLVLAHGVNPFSYAPGDHHLARLRDDHWDRVDYKWIKTIYPPLTQLLLAGTYFVDPTPRRVLLLATAFHLLTLWPLLLLLRARGLDDRWLVVYAWNPLLAVEFATGGHLDAPSVLLLLAALYAVERNKGIAAGALMGLSVMAKTQMLVVAPLLLWRTRLPGGLAFVAVCGLLIAPFVSAGAGDLLSGTLAYASHWESNSGLFAALKHALGGETARVVVAVITLGVMVWLTFCRGDLLLHCFAMLTVLLALSPTLFPWYISWVMPFACLYPTFTFPAITFLLLAPYLHYYDTALAFAVRTPAIALMYLVGAIEYALWRRRSAGATSCRPGGPQEP